MNAPVRAGIVGAGWMGQVHARSWAANAPRGRVVAVTDVSEPRTHALADEHTAGNARVHPNLEALLADPEVDAVDICLPHHLHKDAIVAAARGGKQVLCEKPLCLSFEEARAIRRAIDDAGVTFMCAHNNLFALPLIEARRLIAEGALGRVWHVRSNEVGRNMGIRTGRAPVALAEGESSMAWRMDPARMGGGEVLDTGWHGAYRLLSLAESRPVEVVAMMENYFLAELPTEDTGTLLVRFASGLTGVILTSWAFGSEPGGWQFQVAGEHGVLSGNVTHLVHARQDGAPAATELTWNTTHGETYAREVTHFLDVLEGGAENQATWAHGARTLQLIRGAYLSAQEKRVVTLPEDPTEL